MKTLFVFIAALMAGDALAQDFKQGWYKQDHGTQEQLRRVQFFSRTNGWICGREGNAYRTTDGGEHWTLYMPPPGYQYSYFMNETTAFADGVSPDGKHSTIIRTTDMGQTWSEPDSYERELTAHPDMTHIGDTVWQLNEQNFLRSIDSGKTWTKFLGRRVGNPTAFTFIDSKNGYAVGKRFGFPGWGGFAFTWNGGETWGPQETRLEHDIYDIFSLKNKLIIVGSEKLIATSTDKGVTWEKKYSRSDSLVIYLSVWFSDDRNGTIVGSGGNIVRTTDGGATWLSQNSGVSNWLLSVVFVDSLYGWSVGGVTTGAPGVVLHTSDAGKSWVPQELPGLETISSQVFPQPNNGVANLSFSLPSPQYVTIEILSVSGLIVERILDSEYRLAGEHIIPLNLSQLSSGQYAYRVTTKTYQSTGAFTIIK